MKPLTLYIGWVFVADWVVGLPIMLAIALPAGSKWWWKCIELLLWPAKKIASYKLGKPLTIKMVESTNE